MIECAIFTLQKSQTRLSIWVFTYVHVLRCNVYDQTHCLYIFFRKSKYLNFYLEATFFGNDISDHIFKTREIKIMSTCMSPLIRIKNLCFTLLDQLVIFSLLYFFEISKLFSFWIFMKKSLNENRMSFRDAHVSTSVIGEISFTTV